MAGRPFRFGIINEHSHAPGIWTDRARRAEELGYTTFLIRDHFVPDFFGPQLAPLPSGGHPRARQRLPAPGRAGEGGRHG